MTKALVNALAMALALEPDLSITLPQALAFAEGFVESNAELFELPPVSVTQGIAAMVAIPGALRAGPAPSVDVKPTPTGVSHDTREAAYGTFTPVVGDDGLTDKQRAAVGNVGLCPNCQQPNNDHLPGCARASGEDPRAVTKRGLSPSV